MISAMLPNTLLELAETGAWLEIDDAAMMPQILLDVVDACTRAGGHVTVCNAEKMMPMTPTDLARSGWSQITFK